MGSIEWDNEIFAKINQVRNHSIRYVLVMYLIHEKKFVVDIAASFYGNYNNFLSALPSNKPRYVLLDFEYSTDSGKTTKTLFISWNPDKATPHDKMIFSNNFEVFRKKGAIENIITVEATDLAGLKFEDLVKKIKDA